MICNHPCPTLKELKKAEGKSNKTFDAKHWLLKGSLCRCRKLWSFLEGFFADANSLLAVDLFYLQLCRALKPPTCVGWRGSTPACWQCGWPILDSPAGVRLLCCSFSSLVTSCQVFWFCSAVKMHISFSQSLSVPSHNYLGVNGYLHWPNLTLWNLS